MHLVTILLACVVFVTSAPANDVALRIAGGGNVPIPQWPQMANVLFTWNLATFEQFCGGTILNSNTIVTAAHCISLHPNSRFRVRVGSALASSGGISHNIAGLLPHPFYNPETEDYDIGLMRTINAMNFTLQVQPAKMADINYTLEDNQIVHALGWGAERDNGPPSEQLRVVQIWTINQSDCARRYRTENIAITNNMLCAGSLNVSGRGQCQTDGGGPLFHNGTLVGVFSFTYRCGIRFFPSVNTRISRVSTWISSNL